MVQRLTLLSVLATFTGCVTVYQPLHALQRPVVVSLDQPNFEGVRVKVRCLPGEYLRGGEAQKLCRKVERVFTNQGAIIDTAQQQAASAPKPDLTIDISSRFLSEDTDRLFSVLCVVTGTLIPWTTDVSLAEDVTIRDADGFALASESFQARLVSYFGLAVWAFNGLVDLIFRPPEERITGIAQKDVMSRDFYGHLSQLAFHARTRALVMRNFERGAK